jgi:hypothetical protein
VATRALQIRNANPPFVLFEPEAQELRRLCRILGLTLTVDRFDLVEGGVNRLRIPPTS